MATDGAEPAVAPPPTAFLRVKRKRDEEPLDVFIVDKKKLRNVEDDKTDEPIAAPSRPLVFALAHADVPAAQGDFDRLLREKLATGPLVADFLSVPASPSPASALKDRSGSSTPSKNFEDAREARVRGFAQRTRAVRYKVVSVNRWEASGDDQDEDAGASGSGYHLYDALEEEEAIQLASKPKRPPPKPRPTSTQAKRMAAEAEAEQARIASLLPMLKEYLKVSSDLTQEELDRLGTRAPPPPELDESLPSNATEPADDYVYDLYLVANHESDLSNKPDGFAGESLSADEWRERLLSRPGATAGELVWLEDDDLVMDDDGNESMDSEDSNAEEHYTHDYPDEDVDYSSDQEEFGSDGDLEEGFRGEGPGSDSEDEYGEDDDTDEDEDW